MGRAPRKKVLLVGYSDAVTALAQSLRSTPAEVLVVGEEASDADIPKGVDVVVFVLSPDTHSSTRMHDLFVYVYDRVSALEKYQLPVPGVDLRKVGFAEIAHLPRTSPGKLTSVIWAAPADRHRPERPKVTRSGRRSRPRTRPT